VRPLLSLGSGWESERAEEGGGSDGSVCLGCVSLELTDGIRRAVGPFVERLAGWPDYEVSVASGSDCYLTWEGWVRSVRGCFFPGPRGVVDNACMFGCARWDPVGCQSVLMRAEDGLRTARVGTRCYGMCDSGRLQMTAGRGRASDAAWLSVLLGREC
jgi:hypothetical protein